MINIAQKVKIVLSPNNMNYYSNKGYNIESLKRKNKYGKLQIPRGTTILIDFKDLQPKSHAVIKLVCDYCGKPIEKAYNMYVSQKEKSFLDKDACEDCYRLKIVESNLLKYGNKAPCLLLNINDIFQKFKERKLILLSKEYINTTSKLKYMCIRHKDKGVQKISYAQFKIGQGCKYCGYESAVDKQSLHISNTELVKQFNLKGYDLITKEDLNGRKQKLKYICHKHKDKGILKISYSKFIDGEGCKYCGIEIAANSHRLEYNYISNEFTKRDYTLISTEYINNQQQLEYICNKHSNKGSQFIDYGHLQVHVTSCKYCYKENHSGENHWNWNGGVSEITMYLRDKLTDWKKYSMKVCNYKCVITGKRFDDIHHLYGFDQIFQEVFQETGLPIKQQIKDYTQEELNILSQKCIELHSKYQLGVCLTKGIHELFHKEYGYGQNTPEQFYEFQQRYNNGKFNCILTAKQLC